MEKRLPCKVDEARGANFTPSWPTAAAETRGMCFANASRFGAARLCLLERAVVITETSHVDPWGPQISPVVSIKSSHHIIPFLLSESHPSRLEARLRYTDSLVQRFTMSSYRTINFRITSFTHFHISPRIRRKSRFVDEFSNCETVSHVNCHFANA